MAARTSYIASQAIRYSVSIFIIVTLILLIPRMMPGDPFVSLLGEEVYYRSPELVAELKAQYGLDQPLVDLHGTGGPLASLAAAGDALRGGGTVPWGRGSLHRFPPCPSQYIAGDPGQVHPGSGGRHAHRSILELPWPWRSPAEELGNDAQLCLLSRRIH